MRPKMRIWAEGSSTPTTKRGSMTKYGVFRTNKNSTIHDTALGSPVNCSRCRRSLSQRATRAGYPTATHRKLHVNHESLASTTPATGSASVASTTSNPVTVAPLRSSTTNDTRNIIERTPITDMYATRHTRWLRSVVRGVKARRWHS
ncbi:hypothetical protein H257_17975 [Aphanomyces astaci]|uniref:Uncharacterized protein n=1 Tax=Aphanomyces astaci TaxID=112090 RepID=W4FCQ7_APHAT|nr:hypothetical protein H257_17975 [Aphanomyces astaci]ETV65255.1 hypothetical protein H257_17975 [Aphanomyces astaci]|eukprot:XP_009845256.1 hypothetical protein H257_17975 [Aphanomyces astaci]